MDNYNPRQNTRMRWKDAAEMEKYMFLTGGFKFQTEVLENALIDENYKRLALEINKCAEKSTRKGLIIEDTIFGGMYIGEIADDNSARIISIDAEFIKIVDFNLDEIDIPNYIKMSINVVEEHTVFADNVKTLFGQDIVGTGDINLYRHQITIRFDTDTKEAHYVVYSSRKAQITNYDDFIEVANPISNFNYTAVYVNVDKAEPAFIRFASGTILVGLSTGIEPYTSVSDNVSHI